MMELSPVCMLVGREPICIDFPSPWVEIGPVKELPLVGQLSLPRLDDVYPFLLLNGFELHMQPQGLNYSSPNGINAHAGDYPIAEEDDGGDDANGDNYGDSSYLDFMGAGYSAVELPLFWRHSDLQQDDAPSNLSLDDFIWSKLPIDLVEKIAAFLHVPDVVRLSVVSKQWNAFPCSPSFLKAFTESHKCESSALMFQFGVSVNKPQTPWLAMYDIVDNRWYSMNLNFLPLSPMAPFMNFTVVAASGGLLCLWPESQRTYVGLILCNPVTRSWKELPCRSHDNRLPDFVAMHVDLNRGSYKILVITETVVDAHVVVISELYDSASCKWKLVSTQQSFEWKVTSMVVSAGKVYFVCAKEQWFKIAVFDMEEQQWRSSISLPTFFYEMQEKFGAPEILDCNGRLILVGRVGKHPSKEEVMIWELESSVNNIGSWREVDRMPQDISREFLGCQVFGYYYCIGRGDQIFFIASFKAPMLSFDTVKKAWSWWAWPFYEKYADKFPVFGFVKPVPAFPPFGFSFDLRFHLLT